MKKFRPAYLIVSLALIVLVVTNVASVVIYLKLRGQVAGIEKADTYTFSKNRIWDTSKNFVISRHSNAQGWKLFEKQEYLKRDTNTWGAFNNDVNRHFDASKFQLEKEWELSGDLLRAAFYTAIVGHLYPVGAIIDQNGEKIGPSSVRSAFEKVYKDKGQKVPNIVPLAYHLQANVGECNDYASVLYMLLEMNGIPATHAGPDKSHIHVEAFIDGKTYIFDSLNLFFAPYSAEEFYMRAARPGLAQYDIPPKEFNLLPNGGEDPTSSFYRKRRAHAVMFNLLTSSTSKQPPVRYPHWDKFAQNLKINGTLNSPW